MSPMSSEPTIVEYIRYTCTFVQVQNHNQSSLGTDLLPTSLCTIYLLLHPKTRQNRYAPELSKSFIFSQR